MKTVKYDKYIRETTRNYRYISYNKLNLPPEQRREKLKYSFKDAMTILNPYVKVRFNEQFKVVIPIALYLVLFQIIVMKYTVSNGLSVTMGLAGVILGLMFFMEGLKVGLMPFGETIGYFLPMKAQKTAILTIAFILGVGATFAEPAIGILKEAGKIVEPEKSPLLYAMLTQFSDMTVLAVAAGVGIATLLGILMFIYGWSLKPLILASLIPTLFLTIYAFFNKNLSGIIGLAWDCGAVTTGPVTVPLVLSLGIGTAGVIKHKHTKNIPGFGLVTLASLFPVMSVLILGVILNAVIPVEQMKKTFEASTAASWMDAPYIQSIILAFRAIVPLMLFLYIVQKIILKEKIKQGGIIIYGITLCLIGMSIFNLGLSYGLSPLGNQVGAIVPASYSAIEAVASSPIYSASIGLAVCFLFAFFLGYGATLAEPALNALGLTVENITNGAFRKKLVMISVSMGVALGLSCGVLKIIFDIPLMYLVVPLYTIAVILTIISEEKYVNMGWDSAGVTTGPITVPLVLALGLGFAYATGAADGFGILALASVFPILSVLSIGLTVRYFEKKKQKEEDYV
ncbi:MAG TPA: DUF1538 domain-containing protein [Nitrospiraceae bacterium]|nr:DUF1538 domain-containing protein [Nitrospiraceae bacterium]